MPTSPPSGSSRVPYSKYQELKSPPSRSATASPRTYQEERPRKDEQLAIQGQEGASSPFQTFLGNLDRAVQPLRRRRGVAPSDQTHDTASTSVPLPAPQSIAVASPAQREPEGVPPGFVPLRLAPQELYVDEGTGDYTKVTVSMLRVQSVGGSIYKIPVGAEIYAKPEGKN